MKPETAEDVFGLLLSFTKAAGLGAAMELGLFWLLAEQPIDAEAVGQALGIPGNRSGYLLQLLEDIDLVERHSEGYVPTAVARKAILDTYSQDAWAILAREARDIERPRQDHCGGPIRA